MVIYDIQDLTKTYPEKSQRVNNILRQINQEKGTTIILITHVWGYCWVFRCLAFGCQDSN